MLGLGLHSDVKSTMKPSVKRPAHEDAVAFTVAHLEYKGRPVQSKWKGKV